MKPILVALAMLCLAPAGAGAQTMLPSMAGSWSGTGQARAAPDRPAEPIRCRMSAAWSEPTQTLTVDGLCALAGKRVRLAGTLVAGPFGAITGRWHNPDGPGQTRLAGQQSEASLDYLIPVTEGAETSSRAMHWHSEGRSLLLKIEFIGDKAVDLAKVEFERVN